MTKKDGAGTERNASVGRAPPHLRLSRADYVFEALRERRRRVICRILQTTDDREIEDLAMDVATHESDDDERTVTNNEWELVFASLYHSHIPKLDDLEVVTYDDTTGIVNPGPRFEPVADVLSAVERVLTVGDDFLPRSDE
ncbi:DUF7344 domain-containing protein [Halobaculum limi]|uniref:DUF7344 domain-containing protein n=1 Tax=Halobaculum limi TaxID=3031916 RepID=UPI002406EF0A|nr:hypothetical protein [Halobaculum sp. YSMS11]